MSVGEAVDVGITSGPLNVTLRTVITKAGARCGVCRRGVCLSMSSSGGTTGGNSAGIDNIIHSAGKAPIIKTSIIMGKAAVNADSKLSNTFSLRIPTPTRATRLCIGFVNCSPMAMGVNARAFFTVALGRTTRRVRSIIVATLNVGHSRGTLTCAIRRIGSRTMAAMGSTGFIGDLTNGITKTIVGADSSNINNSTGIVVHNVGSVVRASGMLCIVSNVPVRGFADSNDVRFKSHNAARSVTSVGPSSVRSVSIVAKTTTTTLCNSSTTGNTVLVAAGGNGTKTARVRISDGARFVGPLHLPSFRAHCNAKHGNGTDNSAVRD